MRHANLAILVLLAITTLWMVFQSHGVSSKLDVLVLQQEAAMPDPIEVTHETSWCYKVEREPPQMDLHTKITVKTTRQPGETPAEHWARHLAAIATQEAITPNNCDQHTYP